MANPVTKNLKLELIPNESDMTFKQYRMSQNGVDCNSNMDKIDAAYETLKEDLDKKASAEDDTQDIVAKSLSIGKDSAYETSLEYGQLKIGDIANINSDAANINTPIINLNDNIKVQENYISMHANGVTIESDLGGTGLHVDGDIVSSTRNADGNIITHKLSTKSNATNLENGSGTNSIKQKSAFSSTSIGATALGINTVASGEDSLAIGHSTKASSKHTFAQGYQTEARGDAQSVFGKLNVVDDDKAIIVGGGSGDNRKNIHTLDWDGKAWFAGNVTSDNAIHCKKLFLENSEGQHIVQMTNSMFIFPGTMYSEGDYIIRERDGDRTMIVKHSLSQKANRANSLNGYGIEDAYTKDEIDSMLYSVYHAKGSKTVNEINALDYTLIKNGDVYNVTTTGTITNSALKQSVKVNAGDNIAFISIDDEEYLGEWDVLSATIDLSKYYTKFESDSTFIRQEILNNYYTKTNADTTFAKLNGDAEENFEAKTISANSLTSTSMSCANMTATGEITLETNGGQFVHKLSEKANKDYAYSKTESDDTFVKLNDSNQNVLAHTVGTVYAMLDEDDVYCYKNAGTELHKLSEKADLDNAEQDLVVKSITGNDVIGTNAQITNNLTTNTINVKNELIQSNDNDNMVIISDGSIYATQGVRCGNLCIGETTINENQLKQLLSLLS